MLDIKLLREDPALYEKKLKTKDPEASLNGILTLDKERREALTRVEELKAERNAISKQIGEKKRSGEDTTDLMAKVQGWATEIDALEGKANTCETTLKEELSKLPNLPMDEVKVSPDAADNVCLKTVGEKPTFPFPFKNHLELNELHKLFDFERGAKLAGSGWPVYKGLGARLEWALINYMLSVNIKNGFQQWIPPILARPDMLFGVGQLPKFENQQFQIHDKDFHLYLIPTAEVVLNGLHYDEILTEDELPLKYCAYTPCFRREAGAAGKNERGLIRTHQFNKVEMFCFTRPEESPQVFDQMMANAEEILQGLGLHYRNMLLTTGDMSFPSAKTVDIEVWLPGQDRYYEVSSVSNCTDYQARRSQIRFRRQGGKPELVHTLNGSGLATSRLMVALLENNQQEDGSIAIPSTLQPYLDGLTQIG
ncbi:MAG: serine--tRNA ligase [Chlamydiia bacterium]|nr:serine--tRNA ligase [Chlamydiia bacterium]